MDFRLSFFGCCCSKSGRLNGKWNKDIPCSMVNCKRTRTCALAHMFTTFFFLQKRREKLFSDTSCMPFKLNRHTFIPTHTRTLAPYAWQLCSAAHTTEHVYFIVVYVVIKSVTPAFPCHYHPNDKRNLAM